MVQDQTNYMGFRPASHGQSEEVTTQWDANFPSPFIERDESFSISNVPTDPAFQQGHNNGHDNQYLGDEYFSPISPTTTGGHTISRSAGSPSSAGPAFGILNASGATSSELGASMSDEMIAAAIEEDKRRRNTAASARFRLKKKEREADLEKRARDMTERCEDLQKRIGALETENRWLRELITERGRNRGRRGGRARGGDRKGKEREREREKELVEESS
jgi:hypothetical protein